MLDLYLVRLFLICFMILHVCRISSENRCFMGRIWMFCWKDMDVLLQKTLLFCTPVPFDEFEYLVLLKPRRIFFKV